MVQILVELLVDMRNVLIQPWNTYYTLIISANWIMEYEPQ